MGKKFYITEAIIELEPDGSGRYGMSDTSDLYHFSVRGKDVYIWSIIDYIPNKDYTSMYEKMIPYTTEIIRNYGRYKIDILPIEQFEDMYPESDYTHIQIDNFIDLAEVLKGEKYSYEDYISPADDQKIPYVTGADGVYHLHIINNMKYSSIRNSIINIINNVKYLKPIYNEPYEKIKNTYKNEKHYVVNTLMDMASMINGSDDDHMINLQKA